MRILNSIILSCFNRLKRAFFYVKELKWIRFSIEDLFIPVIQRDPELTEEIERLIYTSETGMIKDGKLIVKPTTIDLNDPKHGLINYRLDLEKKAKGIHSDKGKDKESNKDQRENDKGYYIGLKRGSVDDKEKGSVFMRGVEEGEGRPTQSILKGSQEKKPVNSKPVNPEKYPSHRRSPANNDTISMTPPGNEPGSEIALMEEGANSPDFVNVDELNFDTPVQLTVGADTFSPIAAINDTDKLKDFPKDQKFPYCRQQDYINESKEPTAIAKASNHLEVKGADFGMTYDDQKEPEGARSITQPLDGENDRPVGACGVVMDTSGNLSEPVETRGNLSGGDGDKPGPYPFGMEVEEDNSLNPGTTIVKGIPGAAIGGIIGVRPDLYISKPMVKDMIEDSPININNISFKDKVDDIKKEFVINMENQFLANGHTVIDIDPEDNEKADTAKYLVSRKTKDYLKKHLGTAQAMDKEASQNKKFSADHQDWGNRWISKG